MYAQNRTCQQFHESAAVEVTYDAPNHVTGLMAIGGPRQSDLPLLCRAAKMQVWQVKLLALA